MGIDTKPNFSSSKFEQCTDDIMNLSGCTQIYGIFDIECGATLTVCENAATGKILTSDASGVISLQLLGTPSSLTNTSTNISSGTTHNHAFDGQSFVSGTQGILVDGSNRFYLDETFITDATLPSLYTFSGITSNQSLGVLPSGQTLGMVYITNTGSTTGYFNLGTTPTGDDITPFQTIQVDAGEDVSVTVNMRLSLTENKTIYISSADWTNVGINLQWANITYQNASTTINPGDLPIASETTLGAIKVGSGLDIDNDGVLSVTGGTGGGTVTGAGNGLTLDGTNIILGGTLTGATAICTTTDLFTIQSSDNYLDGLWISDDQVGLGKRETNCWASIYFNQSSADLRLQAQNSTTGCAAILDFNGNNGGIQFCHNGQYIIRDTRTAPAGMQYFGDYSENYTCLSIPNVGYVTGLTSGGTGSGGFLGLVTKASAEPSDLQDNQWVKPEPMSTNCFNYVFDNFLDSGSTAISVNLSLEDVYLRYDETNTAWVKESYNKPLSSGHTWIGSSTCKVCEIPVIDEWVSTPTELCYAGQKYSYPTQTIFQVDIGTCVTIPNKILIETIDMKTVANTCIFSIPAGKTALISSAKLIMLNNASPTSMCVSIGNNSCGTPSLSYQNMISTTQIDDVLAREVYDITPTESLAVVCDGSCCGADVYFRVQSASTSANALCAHLLVEGFLY